MLLEAVLARSQRYLPLALATIIQLASDRPS